MGMTELPADADAGPLLDLPPQDAPPGDLTGHPLLERQAAAVQSARARHDALDRAYAPRSTCCSA
jgi:hypothetical protein